MREKRASLGIDIGGTKVEIAALSAKREVIASLRQKSNLALPVDKQLDAIITGVKELQKKIGDIPFSSMGVAVAGQVDAEEGIVSFAPNLGWHNLPLRQWLQKKIDLPTYVVNDVRAATHAEWILGNGKGYSDFLCLLVGTGIGGGIVSGGRMITGCNNAAGEVGHITIDLHGRLCHCGKRGCFEALAGGRAISEMARETLMSTPSASRGIIAAAGGKVEEINFEHIVTASKQGDTFALKLIDQLKEALCAGICSLANAFNPQRIILGGGIIRAIPSLPEELDSTVKAVALPAIGNPLKIIESAQVGSAAAIGAALLARELLQ